MRVLELLEGYGRGFGIDKQRLLKLQQDLIDDLPNEYDVELMKTGNITLKLGSEVLKLFDKDRYFMLNSKRFEQYGARDKNFKALVDYLTCLVEARPWVDWLEANGFKQNPIENKATNFKVVVYEAEVNDLPFTVKLDYFNGGAYMLYGETHYKLRQAYVAGIRSAAYNSLRPRFVHEPLKFEELSVLKKRYEEAKAGKLTTPIT